MKTPLILQRICVVLCILFHCSKCQRLVKKLPPRLPKAARLPTNLHSVSTESFGIRKLFNDSRIEAKRFFVTSQCNNELELDDEEGVLITTPLKRLDMNCKITIKSKGENFTLRLEVHSNNLKFDCSMESLKIEMDFTSVLLCRGGSRITLTGKKLILSYQRKITDRFGNFVVSVVSKKNLLEEFNSAQESYAQHFNCGLTVYNGSRGRLTLVGPYLQPRIVGGEDAVTNAYPWMAYLKIKTENNRFSCGGSLISDKHILTAAHCLPNNTNEISVTLGRQDLTKYDIGITIDAKIFKTHELFDLDTIRNDIAIVKLSQKVDFSDAIQPICLPSNNIENMADQMATIIGFGDTAYNGYSSSQLQVAKLKIWNQEKCKVAWSDKFSDVEIIPSQICALGINMEDSCIGDSGGPLIAEKFGRNVVLGLTSFGDRCSVPGMPGVYTRVNEFTSWIDKLMIAL